MFACFLYQRALVCESGPAFLKFLLLLCRTLLYLRTRLQQGVCTSIETVPKFPVCEDFIENRNEKA